MARAIYEIKLRERYFPAKSEEDALEMQNNGNCRGCLEDDEVCVSIVVQEEHTMKLFTAAKAMCDTEMFNSNEIEAALRAMAIQMGYYNTYTDVADCVLTWVDRFVDMEMSDLQEWIIG